VRDFASVIVSGVERLVAVDAMLQIEAGLIGGTLLNDTLILKSIMVESN
jgi:hypothetical protein